jgi:hypothetical protein
MSHVDAVRAALDAIVATGGGVVQVSHHTPFSTLSALQFGGDFDDRLDLWVVKAVLDEIYAGIGHRCMFCGGVASDDQAPARVVVIRPELDALMRRPIGEAPPVLCLIVCCACETRDIVERVKAKVMECLPGSRAVQVNPGRGHA